MLEDSVLAVVITNDDVKTVGAVATTIGVLYALLEPRFTRWWRAPLLTIEFDGRQGHPHWDPVPIEDDAFFLRVRVRNAPGCSSAEDAQVLVSKFEAGPLGLDTRALEWSGQRPRRDTPVTTLQIPPAVERHLDVVQIKPRLGEEGGYDAQLCVVPPPWGRSHLLPVGDHELVLTVTAKDVDATSYRMDVSYRGKGEARMSKEPVAIDRSRTQRLRGWLKSRLHRRKSVR